MKTHELKTWPEFYEAVRSGAKTFEIRLDDGRGYGLGDLLRLREWNQDTGYTGREMTVRVTFIVAGSWLAPNHVAMSIVPASKEVLQ